MEGWRDGSKEVVRFNDPLINPSYAYSNYALLNTMFHTCTYILWNLFFLFVKEDAKADKVTRKKKVTKK